MIHSFDALIGFYDYVMELYPGITFQETFSVKGLNDFSFFRPFFRLTVRL